MVILICGLVVDPQMGNHTKFDGSQVERHERILGRPKLGYVLGPLPRVCDSKFNQFFPFRGLST